MLHYVHQLGANCVCLLFGAGQVEYNGLLELFYLKQLPAATENGREPWDWIKTVKLRVVKPQQWAETR